MSDLAFLDRYREIKRRFRGSPALVERKLLQAAKPVAREAVQRIEVTVSEPALNVSKRIRGIIREIAAKHGVTMSEVTSNRRERRISECRQEIYWTLKQKTNWSLPHIGKALGRDHTTILHGCRAHEARLRGEKYSDERNRKRALARWQRLKEANGGQRVAR